MAQPVHILEMGAEVQDIVNMAAVAVMDAQERSRRDGKREFGPPSGARAFSFL
jgi:malate dehydrogenase (oxaloacetate-decarboxylating)(NADP+)